MTINDFPNEFVQEILTLLDLIEIEEYSELAKQRFAIAEKYELTVHFGEQASSAKH